VENNKNSIRFQSRILLFHIPGRYTLVTGASNYNYTVVPFSHDLFFSFNKLSMFHTYFALIYI
jgi:hypothetical protein